MQAIIGGLIYGYIFSTILFFVLSLFIRSFGNGAARYLNIANGLLLVVLLFNFFFWVKDVFLPFYGNRPEGTFIVHQRGFFSYVYLLATPVLAFLFQLLFFKRSFRVKKWATLVSLALLSIWTCLGYIIIFITNHFSRNYMPGSWQYYAPTAAEILITLGFGAVYFLVCRIGAGFSRKELET